MPSLDDFRESFTDLTGSDESHIIDYESNYQTGNFDDWYEIFENTGVEYTQDAFENFLIAFYPQDGMSGDDWRDVREEFYELYGIDDHDIDWEGYREAIGYGRT